MAKSTIHIGITDTSPAERREAIAYVENTDRELMINSFEEIPGEVDRLVAEAFIAGARARQKVVSGTDPEVVHGKIVEALHDGGFGTVGYDMVSAKDVAEDIMDALGFPR